MYTLGIIHLVHTQKFQKNKYFLPPDKHVFVNDPIPCVLMLIMTLQLSKLIESFEK